MADALVIDGDARDAAAAAVAAAATAATAAALAAVALACRCALSLLYEALASPDVGAL